MKIIVKATKLELDQTILQYIDDKIGSLSRFIKKFEEKSEIKTEVEIARTTRHHRHGNVFYAEANIHLPKKIIRGEHSDWDVRVAIDKIKDKLQRELKTYKEEKRDSVRKKAVKARGKD